MVGCPIPNQLWSTFSGGSEGLSITFKGSALQTALWLIPELSYMLNYASLLAIPHSWLQFIKQSSNIPADKQQGFALQFTHSKPTTERLINNFFTLF